MSTSSETVRVWDVPTRIVHWAFVLLIPISWWTAENGELALHRYSGYAVLALLLFRVYWAACGSSTSRLLSFVRGPGEILRYAKGLASQSDAPKAPGHNPLGALSAVTLILLLLAQVTLGLFAVDVDGIESGPLSHLVSFDAGRACAEWHETIFDALVIFIAVHILAVLYYVLVRRDNLIAPMLTGRRAAHSVAQAPSFASPIRLVIGVAFAGVATWVVVRGFWT